MDEYGGTSGRRVFLKSLTSSVVAGAFLGSPFRVLAESSCNAGVCTAQVDFTELQEAYSSQKNSEWCWAASISMLFDCYGYSVSQERIVSEVYGSPLNMPSGAAIHMAQLLNRNWRDDDGKSFKSRLQGAYDFDAKVDSLTNQMLIEELDNDHPMIIGAGGHAMLLTAIEYMESPLGPRVLLCGVLDPWPGRGARNLTPPEMLRIEFGGIMRFVASARVTPA